MITEAKFDWLLKNLEENKSKTQRAIANARRVHEARISQIVSVLTRQGWTEVYVKGTQVYGEQGLLGGAHLVVNITDGVMSFREYLDSQESLLQDKRRLRLKITRTT